MLVRALKSSPGLRYLGLRETRAGADGVESVAQALPQYRPPPRHARGIKYHNPQPIYPLQTPPLAVDHTPLSTCPAQTANQIPQCTCPGPKLHGECLFFDFAVNRPAHFAIFAVRS
eukprot:2079744-Rhodomonas_salina.2